MPVVTRSTVSKTQLITMEDIPEDITTKTSDGNHTPPLDKSIHEHESTNVKDYEENLQMSQTLNASTPSSHTPDSVNEINTDLTLLNPPVPIILSPNNNTQITSTSSSIIVDTERSQASTTMYSNAQSQSRMSSNITNPTYSTYHSGINSYSYQPPNGNMNYGQPILNPHSTQYQTQRWNPPGIYPPPPAVHRPHTPFPSPQMIPPTSTGCSNQSTMESMLTQQQQQIAHQQQQIQSLIELLTKTHPPTPPVLPTTTLQPTFSLPPLDQMLPLFYGKDEENPNAFIQKFSLTINTCNIPTHLWKNTLRNQLRNSALQWYDRNVERFTDFSTFVDLFLQKYDSKLALTKLKATFYGQQQSATESAENFVSNKITLYKRLFPDHSESDMILDIIELLHPNTKVHLQMIPQTIDALLQRLEIIDKANKHKTGTIGTHETYQKHQNVNSSPKNHSNSNNQNPSNPNGFPSYQNNTGYQPKCRYCPANHYHRDCPVLQQRKQQFNDLSHQQPTTATKESTLNKPNPPDRNLTAPSTSQNNRSKDHASNITGLKVSPSITIKIFNKHVPVMIDTGASNCFIEKSMLPEGLTYGPPENQIVTLATKGSTAEVKASTMITFQVDKYEYTESFQIVDSLITPILLGVSWMTDNDVIIDFGRQTIILGKPERENVPFVFRTIEQICNQPSIDFDQVQHDFPPEHVPSFHNLIDEYADVFNTTILQQTTAIHHEIPLTSNQPVYVSPYKMSPSKTEFARKQVRDMLAQNLIESSHSPYNAPVVVVEYADKTKEPRFCVDYRELNRVSVDQHCPGINIHELVRNIGDNQVFCTIDLRKGYWQVPLTKESKPLTAFSAPDGSHYHFKVMPFGLKGAPGTFIRLMGKVLQDLIGPVVEVYLDDLIVKAKDYPELILNLRKVLERLRQFQLTAHLGKCRFGQTSVEYLGHIVTSEQNLAPDAHVTAIKKFPSPKTKKQLQSFIGTCNWLREFLPKASELLAPLSKLQSRKPFKWLEEDERNFQRVKDAFDHLTPLYRPRNDLPYYLQTDASFVGIGATLYQIENDQKRIIANISATLSDCERRYSSNEKECFAVLYSIKRFRSYLEGTHFTLRTDNQALMWLNKFKEERSKLMRWALTLQEYSFTVEHVPGTKNQLPDALSRNPTDEVPHDEYPSEMFPPLPEGEDLPSVIQMQINSIQPENKELRTLITNEQYKDELTRDLVSKYFVLLQLKQDELTSDDKRFLQKYQVMNSLLYTRPGEEGDWRLYVPQHCTEQVIQNYHDDSLYCHPGVSATTVLIKNKYYWPNLQRDVQTYVFACDVCARTKAAGRTKVPPLRARKTVEKLHTWHVDVMGPYTPSTRNNKFLIVVSDQCSKWTEAKPNLRHPSDENSSSDKGSIDAEATNSKFTIHRQAITNQQNYVKTYEGKSKPLDLFHKDSLVFIRNHKLSNAQKGEVAAFFPKFIGPFRIVHVYPSGVYVCQSVEDSSDIRKVSHQDIQLRNGPPSYAQSNSSESLFPTTSNSTLESIERAPSPNSSGSGLIPFRVNSSTGSIETEPTLQLPELSFHNSSSSSPQRNSRYSRTNGRPRRNRKPNPKFFGPSWE
ncbi:hypothetical protein WDU94_013887 [Cyamophila willieti]